MAVVDFQRRWLLFCHRCRGSLYDLHDEKELATFICQDCGYLLEPVSLMWWTIDEEPITNDRGEVWVWI